MQVSWLVLIALAAIVAIAAAAKRFNLPYPIAFVIGGALIAFVPSTPSPRIDPDWLFTLLLPPLLFAGGWYTDWKLFRENLRPIGLLAIGLVVITTVAVALAAHAVAPALGWAAAFTLGAIVSPPDAVAAGAVFERFPVPRRILAILDGEGLVNDATALVIYRFAIVAALTGSFSLVNVGGAFVVVAATGIGMGLLFAFVYVKLVFFLRRIEVSDYLLDNVLTLLAPYACYILTDAIRFHDVGPSAVLACVTAGVAISRNSAKIQAPDTRLVAYSVWTLLIFLLNALAFMLIGLELRDIVRNPSFVQQEIWFGLAVAVVCVVVRMAWVFPATYLPRLLFPSISRAEGVPSWRFVFVIGWSGMRGVVSLAAALALPFRFPGRDAIVFVTFCVIFVTLVFQGLSLIPILKILRIDSGEDLEKREIEVRVAALRAGIGRLRRLEPGFDSVEAWEVEGRLVGEYEYRIAHLLGHLEGREDGPKAGSMNVALDHKLQQAALEGERDEVQRMRTSGEIPDEIYRKIEYDLDLADARLS